MGKTLNALHVEVHALRNVQIQNNSSPTIFEQKVNKIIAETFADTCSECKHTVERLKYQQPINQKQSFLGKIFR